MSMLNSRAGLAVLVAVALLAPRWAEAACKYYDNASAAVSPLPPTDSFVSCQMDAITHNRYHVTACRPDNAPPGVDMNASALMSWLRCYDMRYDPPRCLGTFYRSSSQCINGKPFPTGVGAVTLCREACSEGEWARQTYYVPGNPSQLPPGYPFVSAVDTVPGKAILDLYQYLNQAHDTVVQRNGENLPAQLSVLDLATLSLFVADDAFQNGDTNLGNTALLSAQSLIDFATDFVPGVSLAKDVVTLVTGTNPITGEAVSDVERAILMGGLLLPSAISGAGKGAAKLAKALLRMENSLPAAASFANSLRGVVSHSDDALKKLASDSVGCVIP